MRTTLRKNWTGSSARRVAARTRYVSSVSEFLLSVPRFTTLYYVKGP